MKVVTEESYFNSKCADAKFPVMVRSGGSLVDEASYDPSLLTGPRCTSYTGPSPSFQSALCVKYFPHITELKKFVHESSIPDWVQIIPNASGRLSEDPLVEGTAYVAIGMPKYKPFNPNVLNTEAGRTTMGKILWCLEAAGIYHSDIKPENLLMTTTDDIIVSDFGLSRSIHAAANEHSSPSGTPRFTPFREFISSKLSAGLSKAVDDFIVQSGMTYAYNFGSMSRSDYKADGKTPLRRTSFGVSHHDLYSTIKTCAVSIDPSTEGAPTRVGPLPSHYISAFQTCLFDVAAGYIRLHQYYSEPFSSTCLAIDTYAQSMGVDVDCGTIPIRPTLPIHQHTPRSHTIITAGHSATPRHLRSSTSSTLSRLRGGVHQRVGWGSATLSEGPQLSPPSSNVARSPADVVRLRTEPSSTSWETVSAFSKGSHRRRTPAIVEGHSVHSLS